VTVHDREFECLIFQQDRQGNHVSPMWLRGGQKRLFEAESFIADDGPLSASLHLTTEDRQPMLVGEVTNRGSVPLHLIAIRNRGRWAGMSADELVPAGGKFSLHAALDEGPINARDLGDIAAVRSERLEEILRQDNDAGRSLYAVTDATPPPIELTGETLEQYHGTMVRALVELDSSHP